LLFERDFYPQSVITQIGLFLSLTFVPKLSTQNIHVPCNSGQLKKKLFVSSEPSDWSHKRTLWKFYFALLEQLRRQPNRLGSTFKAIVALDESKGSICSLWVVFTQDLDEQSYPLRCEIGFPREMATIGIEFV
jgi:hypothetical protein